MDRREENRKIAEALGLKVVPCPKEHHPGYCVETPDDNPKYTNHKSVPDFHSPAVFWVEFEKWRASFKVNRPGFGIREEAGGGEIVSKIGERWDLYAIGDMPMRWFDARRWPKILKALTIIPFAICVLPWVAAWGLADFLRDFWRSL